MFKKYFTLEEANQALPAVRQELEKLRGMRSAFESKLFALKRGRLEGLSDEDRFQLECELEFLQMEGKLYMSNLQQIGAELKDLDAGLVDFPAVLHGKAVYLCWKEGEPEITHYHGLEEGYVGRRRVNPEEWTEES